MVPQMGKAADTGEETDADSTVGTLNTRDAEDKGHISDIRRQGR